MSKIHLLAMRSLVSTLLLTCCLHAALGQNLWEEMIEFLTKGTKDECYMSVTGQGDLTKLRISCQGQQRSYWCEYQGKPNVCRSYVNNPVHYYRQMMWDLRKLPHACQEGQRVYKPIMCRKASDEARMVFTAASSQDAIPRGRTEPVRVSQPQGIPKPMPTRSDALKRQPARTSPLKPNQNKVRKYYHQRKTITPRPAVPTTLPESEAHRLAQEYCWRSLKGICSFFIGFFRN
ncbi:hypothetical protein DNTS_031221 [Danionella cerebrum]|uniref:Fibroblast growth factor binding protein 2a n=1 Tax=Danionella cerebrum TaxID=2873325 RepID=A0A553MND4_9TELE|nr:hypothetical protein DNTS_031221 [Danionella translucida]